MEMAEIEREVAKGSVSARVDVPDTSLNVNTMEPTAGLNASANNFAPKRKSKEGFVDPTKEDNDDVL
jgi:hypothetical protein